MSTYPPNIQAVFRSGGFSFRLDRLEVVDFTCALAHFGRIKFVYAKNKNTGMETGFMASLIILLINLWVFNQTVIKNKTLTKLVYDDY